jgi:hypothetical protein
MFRHTGSSPDARDLCNWYGEYFNISRWELIIMTVSFYCNLIMFYFIKKSKNNACQGFRFTSFGYTHKNLTSLPTSREQDVFALLVTVVNRYMLDITRLLQPCVDNLVTSLLYHGLQVVNSLFQTCYNKLGTSNANTTCWQLVCRLVTACLQTCYNLCVFTCVVCTPPPICKRRGAPRLS